MGTWEFLSILLALGSGGEPVADDALKAVAMAEKLAAEEAASIEHFLTSRTQTLKLENCAVGKAARCTVDAFILSPGGASGGLSRECHYDALVSEAVVMPDGTKVFVHLANLIIEPRRTVAPAKRIDNPLRDPEAVAVTAAMIFETPGFHPICFERTVQETDQLRYRIYHLPDLTDDGDPVKIQRVSNVDLRGLILGGLVGAKLGARNSAANGAIAGVALHTSTEDRLPYFQRPFRIFGDAVGCTLTGCPEKLAVSVTVRGQVEQLPIFQSGNPTPYKTDATIMVPRNQLQTLSVKYPDGTSQKVIACSKLQETKVSAAFLCSKAK